MSYTYDSRMTPIVPAHPDIRTERIRKGWHIDRFSTDTGISIDRLREIEEGGAPITREEAHRMTMALNPDYWRDDMYRFKLWESARRRQW